MQAKIIDFASDKLVSALHKIDKKDVQKVMTNISGKMQNKNQPTLMNADGVATSEEYCAMLKNEFVFAQFDPKALDKKSLENVNKTDGILKSEALETPKIKEANYEKIDIHDADCANAFFESSGESSTAMSKPELSKQYSNEVQSFVQKKNIAQGMMDLALLSSNCNQLRYVLDMHGVHPYYFTSLILIGTSLVLQVIVGLGLLYSNNYNLKQRSEMRSANKFSSLSIVGVFLITIINVLIGTFNGTNFSAATTPKPTVPPTGLPEDEAILATTIASESEPVMVPYYDEAV